MTEDEARAIEHDCGRLIALYANLNDVGDWEQVASLFTEDGRLARPTAPELWIEGRSAILAAFQERPKRTTRHICSNVVVTVDGPDDARAESAMALFLGEGTMKIGSFRDRLRRTPDGWRFAERAGSLTF